MGNSGSQQSGNITQRTQSPVEPEQWTHSFPRTPHQHKLVVPDRDAHQRLRPTGNGEILQAGGTISGRNQQYGISRSSSIPAVRQKPSQSPQQKRRPAPTYRNNNYNKNSNRKEQIKRFGSEPDLRGPQIKAQEYPFHDKYSKGRKKYKAPAPPPLQIDVMKQEFDDVNCSIENGSPIRRARLFKTRAETKKKNSSPVNNRKSINNSEITALIKQNKYKSSDALFFDDNKPKKMNGLNSSKPPMQRTRSSPEFQAELREATKRLVNLRREPNTETKYIESKLKTLDHNLNKKEHIRNKLKDIQALRMPISEKQDILKSRKMQSREMLIRSPASGKESTPEQSPPKVKTFYFGMELEKPQKIPNSIGSDISSESENEISAHDISMQLRPILPKKQLEIPRFSPAAAWKLLSSVDTNPIGSSTIASEEGSVFIEDRIEKLPRPPPPYRAQVGPRSNHDKSGDSGISGDETPEVALPSPRQRGTSWTPQQDLGDDSSLEGSIREFPTNSKFSPRPHVFSLSLPRENHLATYINDKTTLQPYSSLQKTKRLSGVLNTLANKKEPEPELDPSENWFLSRSAPNSLNNGFNSLELRRHYHKNDEIDAANMLQPNKRRIMYLPQSNLDAFVRKKHLSKSYENISTESKTEPENLQDPPKIDPSKWSKKPKKFTFQSTVRQIERKRLADRLSREAERKEQQRLRELEAMQRVEEEFQKKRAREKATIRQQLRLYSMDDSVWSSLPPNLVMSEEIRPEPDGAVSSSTSSPTFVKNQKNIELKESKTQVTQVLSEFRQTQRDYKEFRSGPRYSTEQTVHPRITCNMPKAQGTNYTGNYRKDFAHGVKSGESSYSEESLGIDTRNQSPLINRR